MKNVTILHTTADTANFGLGVAATAIGFAVALLKKKLDSKPSFPKINMSVVDFHAELIK